MSTKIIRAVHTKDLDGVLDRLGLKGSFERGELRCFYCGSVVTHETLYAIFRNREQLAVLCTRRSCTMQRMLEGR